jgi:hypothetical protein
MPFSLAKRLRFGYLALQMATKPHPKVVVTVRVPAEIEQLFRIQAEKDDIPMSAFARRMFKLGVATYTADHDSVLGEFVLIWRELNEHQRQFLLKFAELVRSNHIDVYPQDAQTQIPILAPTQTKPHK